MLWSSPFITAYSFTVVIALGLVMGSFLNCWAWRITHGESVLHGRSHCTSCGHALGVADLIPVFSWLFSRGKCRYCGEHVSWRYPASELALAIIYASILARYDLTLETVEMLLFASCLFVLSLTDLDDYLIPNGAIVTAIVVRALYIVAAGLLEGADMAQLAIDSLVGGLVIGVPLLAVVLVADRVLGRSSMGGGDLKLFFVAGLYFGWQQTLLLVIVACVLGIIVAFAGPAPRTPAEDDEDSPQDGVHRVIPFGPSIAVACWLVMLFGQQAMGWYYGLF